MKHKPVSYVHAVISGSKFKTEILPIVSHPFLLNQPCNIPTLFPAKHLLVHLF